MSSSSVLSLKRIAAALPTHKRPQLPGRTRFITSSAKMTGKTQLNGSRTPTVTDERSVPPMGMTSEEFTSAANASISQIAKFYDTMDTRPVLPSIAPGYLQKLLPTSAPEESEPWSAIQADIESKIVPGLTHWSSPNFMAFFASASTYPGMLGELWSSALTAPAFNWLCSPAITELETVVMDWLAQVMALPKGYMSSGTGGGVIQGSASEAVVTVMVAARERYIRRRIANEQFANEEEKEDRMCELRSKLVAVGSAQGHSSAQKAAVIAGSRYRGVTTHKEDHYAMRGAEVRKTLEACKAKGLEPYFLFTTMGTTNTCAVDDFAEIAEVTSDYPDIWVHVDAAWAGSTLVLPEYHHYTKHFASFDSFEVNMHKWLLTNFDAACLFVQRRRDLTDTLSLTPSYLKNQYSDSGLVTDYRDWQIPLGRRFRALKIWFVMRTYGVKGIREYIRHHLKLGDMFAGLVKSRSDIFDLLVPPAFALTVLTVKPRKSASSASKGISDGGDPRPDQDSHVAVSPKQSDEDLKEANEITKEVYEIIDSQKEIFLTSSVIGGTYAIRVVSANPLADEAHLRRAFDILAETAEGVLKKRALR